MKTGRHAENKVQLAYEKGELTEHPGEAVEKQLLTRQNAQK